MDKRNKDSVFAVIFMMVGMYVVWEGLGMVDKAAKPPYNISHFSISPGMLPVVLGAGLLFFSLLLLIGSLRGDAKPFAVLAARIETLSLRVRHAIGEADVRSMTVSVVIMAIYTFLILGNAPFWIGAMTFLVGLMLFLRAGRLWVILTASGASVALIILLFENFFRTILP